ncbi:DUF2848 family protein [Nesterenkonia ebinurensis]|uniref:DUF2848 family protein n=1 Tax=Nesterenkonia ebinurensis TaxID=2608252 RepID=UPI00123D1F2C|nr:DUF2848 family protein [Nesterenkonia ebinurensis]
MTTPFRLEDLFPGHQKPTTLIAGYTGADQQKVREHIDELSSLGVDPPKNIPEFYPLSPASLTQDSRISTGPRTSGEAEPVLIRAQGRNLLTLGSDHTDREIEARSVQESKAVCPKPLAHHAVEFDAALEQQHWKDLKLICSVDGVPYQDGTAALLPIFETLRIYEERFGATDGDLVLFGGTVPLLTGTFVYGQHWEFSLEFAGQRLSLAYDVAIEPALKEL